MKYFALIVSLFTGLNLYAQSFIQKGQTLLNTPSIGHNKMGRVVDISKNGNTIAVGYQGTSNSKGAVKVFDWNGSAWVQRGTEILGDNNGDFAFIVSLSGDGATLAIGSPYWDYVFQSITHTDVGKVRIFDWNGTAWVLRSSLTANLQFNTNTPNLGLNIDLSMDAKSLIITAPGYASGGSTGLYAIYDWSGSNWLLSNSLGVTSPPSKVSISGQKNRIAYSRNELNSTTTNGRVIIMNKSGSSLTIDETIVSDTLNDNFGSGMSLNGPGNTCVIGANYGKNNGVYTGYVKVYQRSPNGIWTQKGSTLYGSANSSFGSSAAINYSGNRIFIGIPESFASHPTKKGAVKVYDWNGTDWVEIEEILGDRNNDNFGLALECDSLGNTFTVGIPNSDSLYTDAGIVKIFEICQASTNSLTASACEIYSVNGQNYTNSGTYTQTLTNSRGCDSILTINLTILQKSVHSMNISSCFSYTLNGQLYSASGTYTQTLTNYLGCDSIITLNLTILSEAATVTQNQNSLTCSVTSALYQWINCSNNSPIANATSQSFYPTQSGSYAVIVNKNGCTDTSDCVNFVSTGMENENLASLDLTIYPNPSSGTLQIQAMVPCDLQILSVNGKLHQRFMIHSGVNNLDLHTLIPAVYILAFKSDSTIIYKKLVIQ